MADSAKPLPSEVDVAIVGAGFGGLGAAIALDRAGFRDFAVIERAPEVGGTWHANTYPGCQCDVPSNLYSFSFARKPDWSRSYPEQPEILAYLRDCSYRSGVRGRIHLSCEMREAAWDEDAQRWRIDTERGALTARFLVCAPGLLSEPKIPAIPGLDGFEGTTVHTARWGDGVDVRGKRVAVVGTGATAIQVVPYLQAEASQLTIFQRTPPWVLPLMDRPLSEPLKRAYRLFPPLQRLARGGVWVLREGLAVPMAKLPALSRVLRMVAAGQRFLQVRDRKLRRKLTPDYVPGCKRILLTNKWYRALTEPNVELVTEGLEEIRGNTLVGSGGFEGEADVIVFATGFSPTDPPIARKLRGSDGRTMAESWAGSPIAHLGSMVAGFPNLFLIYGPNTNLGHSSIVYMLETQQRYLLSALRTLERRGLGRVEVRTEAQESYNAEVQRGLATTVWNTGRCASWYLDANGENSIMWPDFTFRFRQKASTFDIGDHVVAPRREASATQLT